MAKHNYTHDINSVIVQVFLPDSSSTTGAGLTGLTHNSSGLVISTRADNEATATVYAQSAGNIEDITTLGTYQAPSANKCRFKEVDPTNLPGVYEIHLADARWGVSGARNLLGMVLGATNLAPTPFEAQLEVVPGNLKQVNETAQRATDLAQLVQYLFANALADLTAVIQDDSIFGKLLATSGVTNYNRATDSLESIRDVAPHGTAMRGTDSAATASALNTHDGKLDTLTAAEPHGTAMRGTDSASTHDAAAVVTAMQAVAGDFKADVSGLATAAAVNRALGLLQENQYIDNFTFDDNDNVLTFRLRTYSNAESVGTDSNVLATYNCTATYDADGIDTYKMVKA